MLRVEEVTVRYGTVTAVDAVDLEVAPGSVSSVLGPSGSGKSTLLRVVAGLETPDAGRVLWDGHDLRGVPPHRRNFGLMFQDFALFPHRDVAGNVGFGLRMQGMDAVAAQARVVEALRRVGLDGYGPRPVGTLSGGEAQRVALARALAPRPRLLMFDEPLGSLDRPLRARLVHELRLLLEQLTITAIYVTHDQEEAFAIADRVAVMDGGRVVQEGAPEEVWARPGSEFVARFLGLTNIVDAEIENGRASTSWGVFTVSGLENGRVRLAVRPEALRAAAHGPIAGVVTGSTFHGDHVVVRVQPDAGPPLEVAAGRRLPVGERVYLGVGPGGVVPLPV